jgi:hypothetical protein
MPAMKKFLAALLVLASCGEGSNDPSAKDPESQSDADSKDPASDFSQPYLTDQSLGHAIDSLKDPANPYFGEGGQIKSYLHYQAKIEEFNAYARKHGFKDHAEYTAVLSRVIVGRSELMVRESAENAVKDLEKQLQELEAEQKKEADPMRQQQIDALKTAIEETRKAKIERTVNAKDLELIQKRAADIDSSNAKRQGK